MAKNAAPKSRATTLARRNKGAAKRSGAITGSGCRVERRTSRTEAITETAKAARTAGDVQPHDGPSTMPRASEATATMTRNEPRMSVRPWTSGFTDSTNTLRPQTRTITASGTLSQKAQRQPPRPTTTAPSDGPVAAATPPTAPQVPMAIARRSGGNSRSTSAIAAGVMRAPPQAWKARVAMSTPGVGAAPLASAPKPKITTPVRNTRRRP